VFGLLKLPTRAVECCRCGAFYSPLLSALKIWRYARRESNFEHEVIEAVIDTNYRRLIDGRSTDISVGGNHNVVVGSDVYHVYQEPVAIETLSAIMADETGSSAGPLNSRGVQGRGNTDSCMPSCWFDSSCRAPENSSPKNQKK